MVAAVVTLVKDGQVFYNKGFGYTGISGHKKAAKARKAREKAKAEEDERMAKKKMEVAQDGAQQFLTEGAAALLKGVDPTDKVRCPSQPAARDTSLCLLAGAGVPDWILGPRRRR